LPNVFDVGNAVKQLTWTRMREYGERNQAVTVPSDGISFQQVLKQLLLDDAEAGVILRRENAGTYV
jgi:hypothetical protein